MKAAHAPCFILVLCLSCTNNPKKDIDKVTLEWNCDKGSETEKTDTQNRLNDDCFQKYIVTKYRGGFVIAYGQGGGHVLKSGINYEAQENHVANLKLMLDRYPDAVNLREEKNGKATPLMVASHFGNKDAVMLLLERGADPNMIDSRGDSALIIASGFGTYDLSMDCDEILSLVKAFKRKIVVEMMIEKGANVNLKNNFGQTPLHYAADGGAIDVMKLLLENGADPNVVDRNGETPLDWAKNPDSCWEDKSKSMVKLLMKYGAKSGKEIQK